jgi:O-antigen/teichoic acid export membrane protein
LEHLADIETAGLYNAGVKLGMFMSLFVAAFRFAWHPYFLATSKQENAKAIFRKVFTYVMLACLGVFLVLSVYIDDIVRLSVGQWSLVGEKYWDSTVVVPVIMLSYVFYAAYVNFLIGIYLEKKTKVLPFITVAGMLGNLAVNFIFIPQFGMMAAGWARLVAYVIMAVSLYFVAQKLYRVEYEWSRLLKLGLVVFVLFVGSQSAAIQASLFWKTGLVIFFPFLLFAVGFFQSNELDTLKRILKRNKSLSGESQ